MAGLYRYSKAQVIEVDPEPRVKYKRHAVYSPREWLYESITSILALGLLVCILFIFMYMDNQPLSAWPIPVSLNATISILTLACTMALMHGVSAFIGQYKWLHFRNGPRKLADFQKFDEASRGVRGCILLLTTVKWNLATIGAFITILRLTFSPFAQQVILIEQRDIVSSSDTATFGYAHNYSRAILNDLPNSGVGSFPQDSGMQSAIFQGLYDKQTTEAFTCPGVCRWTGSYISLGFKTECRNVTQETLQSATCDITQHACNLTTPAGIDLTIRHADTDWATEYVMNVSSLVDTSRLGLWDTYPKTTLFAIYRSTPDSNSFLMENVNITDCSLSITAYEYTDATANGSDFSARRHEVDFGVKNPWTIMIERDRSGHIYTNESTVGSTHIPALGMTYRSLLALENFLQSTALATEWVAGNFDNKNLGVAAALTGDVDLSDRFDKMATAMTDYLRYGENTQTAHGEMVRSEAFVSIRWEYFVVPMVTEGLAILFAILSIFSNRRSRRVPLWKSSTLAVLACQYEKRFGLLQATTTDIKEIEAESERAEARAARRSIKSSSISHIPLTAPTDNLETQTLQLPVTRSLFANMRSPYVFAVAVAFLATSASAIPQNAPQCIENFHPCTSTEECCKDLQCEFSAGHNAKVCGDFDGEAPVQCSKAGETCNKEDGFCCDDDYECEDAPAGTELPEGDDGVCVAYTRECKAIDSPCTFSHECCKGDRCGRASNTDPLRCMADTCKSYGQPCGTGLFATACCGKLKCTGDEWNRNFRCY
ncbi:hypothetical protein V492_05970 [Pseudogymnoascus sp. VKM F-4246]|nr:hypothetical protein V492_05970 [Pseudogymnoascus sp. VKM F-4246]